MSYLLRRLGITSALLVTAAAVLPAAQAQITETDNGSTVTYTVPTSAANILNQATESGTVNSIGSEGTTTAVSVLTNGNFGAASVDQALNETITIGNGSIITYTFGAAARITEIDTYTGWRDAGRVDQAYQILIAPISAPTTFTLFDTVGYSPSASGFFDSSVRLTPTIGATLSTNVAAIRFSFPNTENGYVGYRELSVLGSTAAPEPTTGVLALAAVGFLPVITRRFRRR